VCTIIKKFFKKRTASAKKAKERLIRMIINDRMGTGSASFDMLRADLIETIVKHTKANYGDIRLDIEYSYGAIKITAVFYPKGG